MLSEGDYWVGYQDGWEQGIVMTFIKIFIGVAASIFVIMHIFDAINKFNSSSQLSGGDLTPLYVPA